MSTSQRDAKKHLKLAIECIGKEMQKHAFDANLFNTGVDTPHTRRSHERYIKLVDALKYLEELQHGSTWLPMFDK